jgi:hypothetical protein
MRKERSTKCAKNKTAHLVNVKMNSPKNTLRTDGGLFVDEDVLSEIKSGMNRRNKSAAGGFGKQKKWEGIGRNKKRMCRKEGNNANFRRR